MCCILLCLEGLTAFKYLFIQYWTIMVLAWTWFQIPHLKHVCFPVKLRLNEAKSQKDGVQHGGVKQRKRVEHRGSAVPGRLPLSGVSGDLHRASNTALHAHLLQGNTHRERHSDYSHSRSCSDSFLITLLFSLGATRKIQSRRVVFEYPKKDSDRKSHEKLLSCVCLRCVFQTCFLESVDKATLCCPMCRKRVSTWARLNSRRKTLVDQRLWTEIQAQFPLLCQRRLSGQDTAAESEQAGTSCVTCVLRHTIGW